MKVYQALAVLIDVRDRCNETGNMGCFEKHSERIERIMETAPHGAGIDCGTTLLYTKDGKSLRFAVSYHHMNETGMYDSWTEHTIIVQPSWTGISIRITGRDRDGIKGYLYDVYAEWLEAEYKG